MHLGDGIKFIDDIAVANSGATTQQLMSTGNENNAVKILIVDVDSSGVRYLLSTFRWLPSTLVWLFYYKTISYRPILISSSWLLHSSGLSCPHANFVEDSFLLAVKKFLDEGGLFIINLVSRSSAVREMVVSRLKAVRWESRHTHFFFYIIGYNRFPSTVI